jgi:uncharacterized damage-inducible protein DinB
VFEGLLKPARPGKPESHPNQEVSMPATEQVVSAKQQFLDAYEREHKTTIKVLRAFPQEQADLRPAPKLKTARELAWIFVGERGLGLTVMQRKPLGGSLPPVPESFDEIIAALEKAHKDFGDLIRSYSDEELQENVTFFVAPKTPGEYTRLAFAWFLLCDQIHHRGQFSVYLRIAGAKVPSIYGPTADEPWN